ncbi:MAG: SlyX family protein [Planctomycetes bacterium]|nr:SlyX family protein [Planctomycetota bacterium]
MLPDNLSDRVVKLEFLVTHLEHEIETLNSVILEQQKLLERLNVSVSRVDDRVARLTLEEERRDPLSERPPHY